ncbi:hypothetical protein ACTQ1N_12455, partial [Porcincola sp. LCP21S3_C12]|uniref:hypothetical protein n=1 Tax=Porcincola sp. LCP21S3_C12 TaxID=3438798 RepID=UPI003F97DD84
MVDIIKESLDIYIDTVVMLRDVNQAYDPCYRMAGCYPAFYLVLNHTTFNQIKKRHSINYSDGFYIGLLYA